MHKLSFLILHVLNGLLFAQSPHGEDFDFDCEECHSTENWKIDFKEFVFDHSETSFELIGQHKILNCQSCHQTLKFSQVKSQCFECHTDIHQNTVSQSCEQCHTNDSWLVNNINDIHQMGRFPLIGAHKLADCKEGHASANNLMFEIIGIECIDCHIIDYQSAKSPDHITADFSKNCQECHQVSDLQWSNANITHDFFPLTGGHNISNCFDCHSQNSFEGLTQDCYTCHQDDFNTTTDPNHVSALFPTDCIQCHTTNPGWRLASFKEHDNFFQLLGAHKLIENDCAKCHTNGYANTPNQCYDCHNANYENTTNPVHQSTGFGTDCESCHNSIAWIPANFDHDNQFFPIYSGKHNNEWDECSDCHTNSANYQVFECITCHEHNQSEMDDKHKEINGYVYESTACLACHPTGDSDDNLNHSSTAFPLTGGHIGTDCEQCHSAGYQGTSTECSSCHLGDFQNSANPNHQQLNLETNCEVCHTTNPNWEPAKFPNHNDFYLIEGAHIVIADDCNSCHSGSYTNNKNDCYDCHKSNYDNTTDPQHQTLGYSTDCETCHSQTAWEPAIFDHSNTQFALTGAHINVECNDCHSSGYSGTTTICYDCHNDDFENSQNPNHSQLSLETNCEVCHTSNPDWEPAKFPNHNDFYLIQGAHLIIANDCNSCHEGNYNNTGNQCVDCHKLDYDNTTDPPHQSIGFDTSCETCHSENAWLPSTFDHDNQFFPIYSGSHNNEWNECSDCHTTASNFSLFECIACHEHNQSDMDNDHSEVQGYQYISTECLACHPTGNTEGAFNHALSSFPLTGAHIGLDCSACHQNGYANTSSECSDCHNTNYTNTVEPNHVNAGISLSCEQCHISTAWTPSDFNHTTTGFKLIGGHDIPQCSSCHVGTTSEASILCYSCHQDNYNSAPEHSSQSYPTACEDCHNTTNWAETSFDHNNTNFALTGAHTSVDCSDCHTSGYTGTSSVCSDCHMSNYDGSLNPNHSNLGLSTACENCHTSNPDWQPADFAVHNDFYLLEGAHSNIANDCNTCHAGDYNNTPNTCYGCHQNDYNSTTDPAHATSGFGTDCEDCHTQVAWTPSTFDHDGLYFPIYSGAHREPWNSCSDCHTNQNDFGQFSCINCHEHNQTDMDEKHKEEPDYSYNSDACYDCHPNGKSDGAALRIINFKVRAIK